MGFLYLIHNLNWGQELSDGNRNSRTVIIGFFCYIALYVLLHQLHYSFGVFTDGFISGLFLMFLADVSVMAYTYKAYYGRGIMNELIIDDDQSKWVYDQNTHKYRRPTSADIAKAEEEAKAEEARAASVARTNQIRETKSKIRAAVFIQRWWRDKLYRPSCGILYLRAQIDWKSKV